METMNVFVGSFAPGRAERGCYELGVLDTKGNCVATYQLGTSAWSFVDRLERHRPSFGKLSLRLNLAAK